MSEKDRIRRDTQHSLENRREAAKRETRTLAGLLYDSLSKKIEAEPTAGQ